ncbi:hypothetical protein [Pseudooceanicola algae]|uniref:Uncharacterized protein n=1 Tax=Pseudooceanicola algae TaxID=1537215 RepID=A0A418SDD3_9RHOB|nr:hypothetical protein [Pseudooceanicola algae]QPM89368.1 hypothetical protein PSAL_005840 [Pseudooceanicola algae]
MSEEQKTETKRGRVRRLLLTPLAEMGFRWKKGVSPEDGQRRLDRVADDLAYLTDGNLDRLFLSLQDKGEGSARCFWPVHATFVAYAQLAQPRPLEEMPGLASWFASKAGQRAQAEDCLVAHLRFWMAKRRPPMNDAEHRRVAERASEMRDRVIRLQDKIDRGWLISEADEAWLDAYRRDLQRATALVDLSGQGDAA